MVSHGAGILADEVLRHRLHRPAYGTKVALEHCLAPSLDPCVRRDPQELPARAYVEEVEGTDRYPVSHQCDRGLPTMPSKGAGGTALADGHLIWSLDLGHLIWAWQAAANCLGVVVPSSMFGMCSRE